MIGKFLALAGTAAILVISSGSAQAAQTWVCNIFAGPKHFINKPLRAWKRDVEKVTKGEVKIRYLGTSASPPPKQIDGIVGGTFDCAFIFHAFTAKRAIGPGLGILPFLNRGNAEHGSVAYWRVWKKYFERKKEFEDDGIKILSMFHFGGVHFFTATDKPIMSVDDMKNQKMWALAGTSSRTMKVLGVNHVSGPAVRVAEFTQTKVVQGIAGLPREGIVTYAGVQFPKHGTITEHSMMMPSFAWMVSLKKWNALNRALQAAILSVSEEKLARNVGLEADKAEISAKVRLAKVGIKEHKASKAFELELKKAGQLQMDAWIARTKKINVDGAKAISEYQSTVSKLDKKK